MAVRKAAGYAAKARNFVTRKRKSVLLISAEGNNKTETAYFRNFNNDHITVRFARGNATDPANMATRLAAEYVDQQLEIALGDLAVCLIDADCDDTKDSQITEADSIAAVAPIQIIVSNPCFEIWYLCHLEYSTRQYSSNNQVLEALKRHLPGYTKADPNTFSHIQSQSETAVLNAKRLEQHCQDAGYTPHTVRFSPSTEVYKIMDHLNHRM